MTIQTVSALVTIVVVALILAIFVRVRVLSSATSEYAPVTRESHLVRASLFAVMVIVGLPISIWLLGDTPFSPPPAGNVQVVNVSGSQWYWDIEPSSAVTGEPVEFRVTSTDVNHGFGLYDERGEMVAQTQAMPGYVNRLTHVFDKPGTYQINCLEYCGLAHHEMIAQFEVADAAGATGAGAGGADANAAAGPAAGASTDNATDGNATDPGANAAGEEADNG